GEQALEIADTLVRSGAVDVIVVDSVAALVPKAEIEGEMGDSHVGLQARLMSQALRKLTATVHKSNCTLFFINQIRMKIGVMFGSPETTTGGNALKFYSSVRLDIRRVGTIKQSENAIGNRTRVKVVKNKLAPPFKVCEFDVLFGQGISKSGDILDLAVENGLIEKSGAWYSAEGERIGQGRDNARTYLEEHPELLATLEAKIRAKAGIGLPVSGDGGEEEGAEEVDEAASNGASKRRNGRAARA
ncbi:MAG TPA: recombinase RecA, partial [Sandaracinaceae bacterium]